MTSAKALASLSPSVKDGDLVRHVTSGGETPPSRVWDGMMGSSLSVSGGGTRSRREESSSVGQDDQMELALLRELKAMASDDEFMFGGDTGNLARALALALKRLGLDTLGITPHSARAGFATDSIVRRIPCQQFKVEGRWQGDSSLKIYTDAIISRAISSVPSVARWRTQGEASEHPLAANIE